MDLHLYGLLVTNDYGCDGVAVKVKINGHLQVKNEVTGK